MLVNPHRLKEDYETGGFTKFNWLLSGNKNWLIDTIQYYNGTKSARSGLQSGDNNMNSMMQLPIKVQTTDSISFYVKVSSEDGSANGQYWDYLEFKIDNMTLGKWQGELDWTRRAYSITSGTHLLTWNYSKDQVASSGDDCAWIDYIVFPPLVDDTKIDNATAKINLSIYPNPTRDFVNILISDKNLTPVKIKVYNASGTFLRVFSDNDIKKQHHKLKLNTSDLSSGIYFISIQTSDYKVIRKFIKF